MTQGELAERLGCDRATVGRHNKAGDLPKWSRKKDKAGVAWRHLPDPESYPEKLFVPIIEEGEQEQPGKQNQAA